MRRLWKERKTFNAKATNMMRDTEFPEDLVQFVLGDMEKGFMTTPIGSNGGEPDGHYFEDNAARGLERHF